MNVQEIRKDFPILHKPIKGKPLIYLDSTATSLKPQSMIDAINEYYTEISANIHRGVNPLVDKASRLYDEAHAKTAKFINAKGDEEIIFTKNTTESINLVMYSLLESGFFSEGDEILVSKAEHHSNLVPWQFIEKKTGAKLVLANLNDDFTLNTGDFESKLNDRTKLVALQHASNTVGSIHPIKELVKKVKRNNSETLFLCDAAQSVPHMPVDVKDLGCDFLTFSAHKMLGPTGIGVLYAKKELLEKMPPFLFGGDMIHSVQEHSSSWNKLPYKFEAGTPNIAGGIGFGAALDYLNKVGMKNVRAHEKELLKYVFDKLEGLEKLRIFNPQDPEKQCGIVLFDIKGLSPHQTALALFEISNIAIRSGMHCAEPLISKFNPDGLARASFYLYNTEKEIDLFVETLKQIISTFT